MDNGFVHVYTGNGKGKTTAALGLAVRAIGAGKKVYIGQFMKSDAYHEIKALRQHLPTITLEQYGHGTCLVSKKSLRDHDYQMAKAGLERVSEVLRHDNYDVVIADEINVAAYFGLVSETEILALIDQRPPTTELVLTGRYATDRVIDKADLVTEMTEVKHYYQKGILARDGIER